MPTLSPNRVILVRMTFALNDLKRDAANTPLQRVLFGQQLPEVDEMKPVKFFDDSLNQSQREAVQFALAAKEIALVHGPPGWLPRLSINHCYMPIDSLLSRSKNLLPCGHRQADGI